MEVFTLRLIAKMPNREDVGALVDSLRNVGLDRKDMIISSAEKDELFGSVYAEARESILVKNERDALGELESFTSGIEHMDENEGIVVAVEVPKHASNRVREIMEQSGAVQIIQD
jgi:hypothetical protein